MFTFAGTVSRFSSSCDFRMAFCSHIVFTAHDSFFGNLVFVYVELCYSLLDVNVFLFLFSHGRWRYLQTCGLIFTLAVCTVQEGALSCGLCTAGGGIRSNPESVTSELELAALQLRFLVVE